MNTLQLVLRAFSMLPVYLHDHPVNSVLVIGLNLLAVLFVIAGVFRRSLTMKAPVSFLYLILRVSLCLGYLTFGLMLLLGSEVAEAVPEQFNRGFYIEIMIVCGLMMVLLIRKFDKEDPAELEGSDTADAIVKTAFIIICSILFMIFGNGVIRWGFSLFGKKIGAWFFGVYAGWAVGTIFDFLLEANDILFLSFRGLVDRIPERKPSNHGSRSSKFMDGLMDSLKSGVKKVAIIVGAFFILSLGAGFLSNIMNPPPKMPADHVMVWNDSVLESKMREITGIVAGDIWLKDVWEITELDLGREYNDNQSTPVRNLQALSELKNLNRIDLGNSEITDISALAGLSSLAYLNLDYNQISDLSPLAGLTSLYELSLWRNQISDVSPLAGLTRLHYLHLSDNQISDISPLARLTSLRTLSISDNDVSDISILARFYDLDRLIIENNHVTSVAPLEKLKNLTYVDVAGNPLMDAYILENMDIEELHIWAEFSW